MKFRLRPFCFRQNNRAFAFVAEAGEGNAVTHEQIISLLSRFNTASLDVIKTENLYNFDGAKGYSAQVI